MVQRKRRLRKKLHLDEFQEMGFTVYAEFHDSTDMDDLADAFILNAIEKNGLVFGGSVGPVIDGFVTLSGKGSATDEHRNAVKTWFFSQPVFKEIVVGELVDAWYGH